MVFTVKKTLLACTLALAVPFAYAQGFNDLGSPYPHHYGKKAHKMAKKWHKVLPFYGVQLSQKQDNEIFNIRHAAEVKFREKRLQLRQLEEEMFLLRSSEQYTLRAAKDLQTRISKVRAELDLMRVETDFAVFNVLTPEQKAQVRQAPPMWNTPFRDRASTPAVLPAPPGGSPVQP